MNELDILRDKFGDEVFQKWIQRLTDLSTVESFDDLSNKFLKGRGLSPRTYESYLRAVKKAYTYLDGKHPWQWSPVDIENCYDHERSKNGIGSAYQLTMGLKQFLKTACDGSPVQSPFDLMTEKLHRKLHQSPSIPELHALYQTEIDSMLHMLRSDASLKGIQNLAMIELMLTTGLRVSEVCALSWGDLEHDTDNNEWRLSGIGKGSKPFRVAVPARVVTTIRAAYRATFKRDPRPADALIYSTPNYNGKKPTSMTRNVAWRRITDIGRQMQDLGLVRRSVKFSPHMFRRTFLTQMLKKGMTVSGVQRVARHSSIQTTTRYLDDDTSHIAYAEELLGVAG